MPRYDTLDLPLATYGFHASSSKNKTDTGNWHRSDINPPAVEVHGIAGTINDPYSGIRCKSEPISLREGSLKLERRL